MGLPKLPGRARRPCPAVAGTCRCGGPVQPFTRDAVKPRSRLRGGAPCTSHVGPFFSPPGSRVDRACGRRGPGHRGKGA
eukprot:14676198-Alexandrium_andersonii.AAC.1